MSHTFGSSSSTLNVLLIGGGGREHALASKIAASPRLGDFYATHTDNPGIASLCKPVDVPVNIREIYRLKQFIQKKDIGLVVIGPEDPLAEGYTDKLADERTLVFGPTREAAQLEADKAFAKQIMRAAGVPTADSRTFTDPEAALEYLRSRETAQVVKASGLAKGKGVIVPANLAEAEKAIERMMVKLEFGDAGRKVIIEERLAGPEVSVLAIVDGKSILVLPPCQDHKRLKDGDAGPNTGGMGAFCPANTVSETVMALIERQVLVPTVDAMRREGIEFRGVLYAGLMLTHAGPRVLEFNTRFGDPECQPLMARLKSDLVDLLVAACTGRIDEVDIQWDPRAACCVVLASDGYPEKPKTGVPIYGLEEAAEVPDVSVFHAGTKRGQDGGVVTSGGRVLSVTGLGDTMAAARARAYEACEKIVFTGKTMRTDIAAGV
ncbi:MAG: phosphoribosylamine--glycine ligase [Planctomycetes bacterium]|nr:phosphoribosylamine--glycine ligase [Planctomycetota bacterium]